MAPVAAARTSILVVPTLPAPMTSVGAVSTTVSWRVPRRSVRAAVTSHSPAAVRATSVTRWRSRTSSRPVSSAASR